MTKTMIKNGRKYIRSKNSNWSYRCWFVRTMKTISFLLKMLMIFGVIIFVSEPLVGDNKSFMMTVIIKSIASTIIVLVGCVLSKKIDESF